MQGTPDVPERHLPDTGPEELAARIQLCAAVLMFSTGQLSAGAAAEFAGIDRYAFVRECARHGVPMIDYPEEGLSNELGRIDRRLP